MNHGRAVTDKRAAQGVQRFEHLSRYLVGKGFAVLLPTRVGYVQAYGDFDPKDSGNPCSPQQVASVFGTFAKGAKVSMLWLYWQNELCWGAGTPRRWHEAWAAGLCPRPEQREQLGQRRLGTGPGARLLRAAWRAVQAVRGR
jgi:hypothetical protein